jgi:hypothetical protein
MSVRPTLPSIRTLDLSRTSSSGSMSTTSSDSRAPSPAASDTSAVSSIITAGEKLRLVPCPLDVANAIVLVTPPIPNPSHESASPPEAEIKDKQGQAFLLVGPAMNRFRHPQRQLSKGARVHPYRIVRAKNGSRCPSPM